MTALLVYRNDTAPVMAWAKDADQRGRATQTARFQWMEAVYDAADVPEELRGAFIQDGHRFSGIAWPETIPLPKGWLRPRDTPQLIRPRLGVKIGKTIDAQMREFDFPDTRAELRQFGMPGHASVGLSFLSCGVRAEDDGVWVTWGNKDVANSLGDVESNGWVRVPLVEYIERFGEDAL